MEDEYDFSAGARGALDPLSPRKTRITVALDDGVLDWFRAQVNASGGGNYPTLINDALREHIRPSEPLEELLRRVLRDELQNIDYRVTGSGADHHFGEAHER